MLQDLEQRALENGLLPTPALPDDLSSVDLT